MFIIVRCELIKTTVCYLSLLWFGCCAQPGSPTVNLHLCCFHLFFTQRSPHEQFIFFGKKTEQMPSLSSWSSSGNNVQRPSDKESTLRRSCRAGGRRWATGVYMADWRQVCQSAQGRENWVSTEAVTHSGAKWNQTNESDELGWRQTKQRIQCQLKHS